MDGEVGLVMLSKLFKVHLIVTILYLWSAFLSLPEHYQICYSGLKTQRLQIPHGTEKPVACHMCPG